MKTYRTIVSVLAALLLGVLLCACRTTRNAAELGDPEAGVDLDLTRLSSTMVYAEVFNMRYEPEPYYGKVVRMKGYFSPYENPYTGEPYFNCVIPDATACCSQGLQFFLADPDALVYPDDYPKSGDVVIVTGTFTKDEENIYMCAITDAEMELAED